MLNVIQCGGNAAHQVFDASTGLGNLVRCFVVLCRQNGLFHIQRLTIAQESLFDFGNIFFLWGMLAALFVCCKAAWAETRKYLYFPGYKLSNGIG
jgi:hypothetical protein